MTTHVLIAYRDWSLRRKGEFMEDVIGRGLECLKTMDGKVSNENGLEKEILLVVWRLGLQSLSLRRSAILLLFLGGSQLLKLALVIICYLFSVFFQLPFHLQELGLIDWLKGSLLFITSTFFFTGKSGKAVYFNNPMWPGECNSYI